MDTLSYKTAHSKLSTLEREWYIIDAEDKIVGRLATEVANILRGKNKPNFSPHICVGDYVIIINAGKVKFTGAKWDDKKYMSFSGYPSGQSTINARDLLKKNPISIIEKAVRGMLPRNKLGRATFKNMFVYEGTEHPHNAQKPKTLEI